MARHTKPLDEYDRNADTGAFLTQLIESLALDEQDVQNLALGLEDFVCRDWARRLWVQQELYSARSVVVYCGGDTPDWPLYRQAAQLLDIMIQSDTFEPTNGEVYRFMSINERLPYRTDDADIIGFSFSVIAAKQLIVAWLVAGMTTLNVDSNNALI